MKRMGIHGYGAFIENVQCTADTSCLLVESFLNPERWGQRREEAKVMMGKQAFPESGT
jgi:hypothetical protein